MKCGVSDCPYPARGRYVPRDGGPGYRTDYDPLCADHALLSSLRSQASLVRAGSLTGRDRARSADRAWVRTAGAGLPVPEDRAVPTFARGGDFNHPAMAMLGAHGRGDSTDGR